MSKILNYGSLNLDYVYRVEHFVQAGETITSNAFSVGCGGKGLNQSIACARAGAEIFHAGKIGANGGMLKQLLETNGVHTEHLKQDEGENGHAIIQVNDGGENCILLFPGSNRRMQTAEIDAALAHFSSGDYLLLQNEINALPYLFARAAEKGMRIVFNPSPITPEILGYPLEKVALFVLNRIEGEALSGETEPERILRTLYGKYPQSSVLLTLGGAGSVYFDGREMLRQPAYPVQAVDTTAAGDTFTGYFVAAVAAGKSVPPALETAAKAAAIACTRPGAAASIPNLKEVL